MFHSLRFARPQTILQVGAYEGDDSLIDACARFGHNLYMFEPIPERAEALERKAGTAPTLHVIQVAVSNYNGRATFNIANHDDCSSLQAFDPEANTNWVHEWHPYRSFEVVRQVEVKVMRLDAFLGRHNIQTVDLLEVDAQGEDLRVVESLGERAADVKRIQIEVNVHTAPLYDNGFTMAEALALFAERNFEKHLSWKQSLNREENVVFRNRRYYPHRALNALTASAEGFARSLYHGSQKLPRILAVTKMMMMRSLGVGKAKTPGA